MTKNKKSNKVKESMDTEKIGNLCAELCTVIENSKSRIERTSSAMAVCLTVITCASECNADAAGMSTMIAEHFEHDRNSICSLSSILSRAAKEE